MVEADGKGEAGSIVVEGGGGGEVLGGVGRAKKVLEELELVDEGGADIGGKDSGVAIDKGMHLGWGEVGVAAEEGEDGVRTQSTKVR